MRREGVGRGGVNFNQQYEIMMDVSEHEVFMTFDHDDDCNDFQNWLEEKGWNLFTLWQLKREVAKDYKS